MLCIQYEFKEHFLFKKISLMIEIEESQLNKKAELSYTLGLK